MTNKLTNKDIQHILTTYSAKEKALLVMDAIATENTNGEASMTSEQQMSIMNSLVTAEDKAIWNTIREHAQKLEATLNQLIIGDLTIRERINFIEGIEQVHTTEKLLLTTIQEIIDLAPPALQQTIISHVTAKKEPLMSGPLKLIIKKGKPAQLSLSAEDKLKKYIEEINQDINALAEDQVLLLEDMEELLTEQSIDSYKKSYEELKNDLESSIGDPNCDDDDECC
ncbi:hypothetical protein H0X48_04090 [Candidatus Dependentiae bacterium]|nr:hypothetical protein [Candidatus Dependentiae bacterium]